MKYFVVYTVLRIGLFLATAAVLTSLAMLVLGSSQEVYWGSLFAAAVLSSLLSLKLLAGPRERLARSVEDRATRARAKLEEIRSREDVD